MNNYPVNDQEFRDHIISEVTKTKDQYDIKLDGFYISLDEPAIEPEVGMACRTYGSGLGSVIRGVFLNGQKIYYLTTQEQKAKHDEWVQEQKERKIREFEEEKEERDRRFSELPAVFQSRIMKFRNTNPNFRYDFEPYELMCCEQAVKMAKHFGTAESLQEWAVKPYDSQKEEFPELDDGHSGNSMAFSIRLAYWYLTDPDNVIKEHGSLTPLTGCEAFGCPHPKPGE